MTGKALLQLNPLLTDRVRLAIVATLAASEEALEFNHLLDTLDLTKGNLSSHMRKLEEGKLVKISKEFVGRKPRTTYTCTARGRKELQAYLEQVESLLKSTGGK